MFSKRGPIPLFPFVIQGRGDARLVIEELAENHIPAIYKMIRGVIDGGKSAVSSTEFVTEETFRKFLSSSTAAFSVKESSSRGNIIGFINIAPQGFFRSALPISTRGYTIMDPSFRGQGVYPEIIRIHCACAMAAGYLGYHGHMPQKYGNSDLPSSTVGFLTNLHIPSGVHLLQTGWWDDHLIYLDFVRQFPHLPSAKMNEGEVISRALKSNWMKKHDIFPCKIDLDLSVRPHNYPTANVRKAKEGEIKEIYDMLGSAAKSADGCGVDEFPSFPVFCKKNLAGRSLHVIEDMDRTKLMGAVIVGQSHLTRGNPNMVMMYIYLLPSYRRHGYGSHAEKAVAEHLNTHGYIGVFTDMLMTNSVVYRFASRAGYIKHRLCAE